MTSTSKTYPRHVAIIMDGNRRWAKKRGLPSFSGHVEGANRIDEIVESAKKAGIKTLTLYSFSTENWSRTQEEVAFLFEIFENFLNSRKKKLIENKVRFQTIGDLSRLPLKIQNLLQNYEPCQIVDEEMRLVLAVNYGSRDEIARAIRQMAEDVLEGKLAKEAIREETLGNYLDTKGLDDPDLLIRTSGEMRVSNFLLWQISYAEMYISPKLWPDFNARDLEMALEEYQLRQRRLGA